MLSFLHDENVIVAVNDDNDVVTVNYDDFVAVRDDNVVSAVHDDNVVAVHDDNVVDAVLDYNEGHTLHSLDPEHNSSDVFEIGSLTILDLNKKV